MKAFVTGATGFVGSHLAAALVARGDTVVALVRKPEAHAALTAAGITPAAGSLENDRSLSVALADVDVVYHCAGLTSARNEAEFFTVNELGTRRLLDATRRTVPGLARFVYVSSQAALGPSPRGTPLGEDAECRPLTAYGRSKLAGELAVRGAGLPWTVVRPSSVYGPRDRAFLPVFTLARRGIAPVFGTGAQELSLVYVTDLADAIARAGTSPEAASQIIHAAHPEVVLSRDVAKAAGAAIGTSPLVIPIPGALAAPIVSGLSFLAALRGRTTVLSPERLAEFMAPAWLLSVGKAERLLGWKAECDIATGMRRTAAWYKAEGWIP